MGRDQRLRVLGTLTTYPPSTGGAQLHQHTLFRHMGEAIDLQVATFWDENRTDWLLGTTLRAHSRPYDYVIDGVPVRRIGLGLAERLLMAPLVALYYPLMRHIVPLVARKIQRHLEPVSRGIDVVHNVRIGREPLSFASLYLARKRGAPFVLTPVHHPRWAGWRYRQYLWLYRNADIVLALTYSERQVLVRLGVPEHRVVVTGNGPIVAERPSPEAFTKKHGIDGPIILFLGQHFDYKGFVQVLEAAPAVWGRHANAHFVFIGPPVGGSERFFREVDPRIRRLGKVSLQEKSDALAASTVLCVPSTQESFGGVYVEAWCHRRPVIGCRIPAVSEVVTDGVDGFLIEQSPAQIAAAILEMLDNSSRADAMGEAGWRKVQERYDWPSLARKTLDAYRTAIGRAERTRSASGAHSAGNANGDQ